MLATLPFYPLLSFLLLVLWGRRMSWAVATLLSVGTVLCSAISAGLLILRLMAELATNADAVLAVTLWPWFRLGNISIGFSLHLDALSAVMIGVVSGVGFLIHLYAAGYMKRDENYSRFMAYMNLFIVAMLLLVLADNLVLLYLGWEGVGLCSFLLIGFWYQQPDNVKAARKAFIVTRVGDTAMAIALFMLFSHLGQLTIADVISSAQQHWQVGDSLPFWITLLLLGGAVGKSAQLPLQTWLPDAMAGPTPVSALIHAATMVTAGVYLIARMHELFLLAPQVMHYVAWCGGLTLLLAGVAALAQTDIKRVLAYSTMSQIGYMMLALGAGAWGAGIFHLMTHAFFKALLFLTAGSIIAALHHQQNIFAMGGLWKKLPVESLLFAIGLLALIALPGTSGFFSKEQIIAALWSSSTAGPALWWAAIIGALLTSIYSCRLFFLVFFGRYRGEHQPEPVAGWVQCLPLYLLALLALAGGMLAPRLGSVFASDIAAEPSVEHWQHWLALATPFIGILFSWFYFSTYRHNRGQAIGYALTGARDFALRGLGFDTLYDALLVRPYCWLAAINRRDIVDQLLMSSSWYTNLWHEALAASQNGSLRWYAATLGLGLALLLGVLWL